MNPDETHIAEFQKRRREFQPQWNAAIGLFFFPGFLLFIIGAQFNRWVVIPGIILCLVGAVRGLLLILQYRRCPACNAIQISKIYYPYRTCRSCGVRLSVGVKDSS